MQVFSCEFCEISKTPFLTEHLRCLVLDIAWYCWILLLDILVLYASFIWLCIAVNIFFSCSLEEKRAFLYASHLDHGGLKAKNQLKSLFSHFYVVPQKVLWRPLTVNNAVKKCGNKNLHKFLIDFFFFLKGAGGTVRVNLLFNLWYQ